MAGQSPCRLLAWQGPVSFPMSQVDLMGYLLGVNHLWDITQGDWSPREVSHHSDTGCAVGTRKAEPGPGPVRWGSVSRPSAEQQPTHPVGDPHLDTCQREGVPPGPFLLQRLQDQAGGNPPSCPARGKGVCPFTALPFLKNGALGAAVGAGREAGGDGSCGVGEP